MGDNNESLSGFAAKTKGYERYKKSLFVTCDTHISYIEFLSGYFGKALISSLSFLAAARSSVYHMPLSVEFFHAFRRLRVSHSIRYLEISHTFVTLHRLIDISPIPIDVIDLQALMRIPRPDVLGEPI